ncbi:TetR/AcrR family transcriptional regulator [Mycolicibacterium sp. 018/SC-01/001]|uniref:TetR/AcrR family transcriptional regulator n=1 Tax=Mycolicibacterium sp. 018/SC-01/001 TaxID=2592069 RepID=UPI002102705D|nr:TetR/AcrR family transcriptional regulator [Mycolicibacterium sp. 018/SC-01/001]
MAPTEGRGSYAKGVRKREEILAEALAAYGEHAGDGPSLKTIAARVGLSEQGLLHYFGSREALFTAILAERDRLYRQVYADGGSLESLLAAIRLQVQTPGLSRLYVAMAATAADPARPPHRYFTEHFAVLSEDIQNMLVAQPHSRINPATSVGDADGIAFLTRILIAAADGLQLRSLVDDGLDVEADLARLAAVIPALLGVHA